MISWRRWLGGGLGLLLCAFVVVCTAPRDPVSRDALGFEVDPPGQWWRGDMHVHATGASNDTGGDSTPEAIAKMAQVRGLHFVVLTDHSNSTGSRTDTTDEDPKLFNKGPEFPFWEKAKNLSVPGKFLLIDGNEISPVAEGERPTEARGHIGCIPADLASFKRDGAFIDRPRGKVTGGEALRQAKARGCFAIVNHPYGAAPWIAYDWTNLNYDGIEVWNGSLGYDSFDQTAYDTWRCDLLKKRKVTPIAASDNHRVNLKPPGAGLNPALGWPMTSVYARSLAWPQIMAALKAGMVALHEGQSFLEIDGYDAEKRRQEGASLRWFRLRGKLDPKAGSAVLSLRRVTACQDPRPKQDPVSLTEKVVWKTTIKAGASFDRAVEMTDAPAGVYTATLLPRSGDRYVALSRAIVVNLP